MSNEKEIIKRNMKLTVFDSFSYDRLKEVCDKICELGFDCEFVSNGNIVFTDLHSPNKTENGVTYLKDKRGGGIDSDKEGKPTTLNSHKEAKK